MNLFAVSSGVAYAFLHYLKIICFDLVTYKRVTILDVQFYPVRSLTLRVEHRLRVFENRVLRKSFGHKRDEIRGGWRKLHNEELHKLYFSLKILRMINSRRMRWEEHIELREEECMQGLVGSQKE
jgi:hypothetical protein